MLRTTIKMTGHELLDAIKFYLEYGDKSPMKGAINPYEIGDLDINLINQKTGEAYSGLTLDGTTLDRAEVEIQIRGAK